MPSRSGDDHVAPRPPLGQQVHLALVQQGPEAAIAMGIQIFSTE